MAGDIRAAAVADEEFDAEHFVGEWMKGVGRGVAGYVTPKIAVGAVVHNERREILLVQRADSGIWLYPTGWADVGYSASEIAVKEVKEETGIDCVPVRLIALLDGLRLGFTRVPLYSLVFLCRATGGALEAHPLATRDVGWFPRDAMPQPLAGAATWPGPPNRPLARADVGGGALRAHPCEEDVPGLQVAVNDPVQVGVVDGPGERGEMARREVALQ